MRHLADPRAPPPLSSASRRGSPAGAVLGAGVPGQGSGGALPPRTAASPPGTLPVPRDEAAAGLASGAAAALPPAPRGGGPDPNPIPIPSPPRSPPAPGPAPTIAAAPRCCAARGSAERRPGRRRQGAGGGGSEPALPLRPPLPSPPARAALGTPPGRAGPGRAGPGGRWGWRRRRGAAAAPRGAVPINGEVSAAQPIAARPARREPRPRPSARSRAAAPPGPPKGQRRLRDRAPGGDER